MARNALIICNFRLRNSEEFNKIVKDFKGRKYDLFDIGEIDRDGFDVKILEEKINEINNLKRKYENISVISNIRDVLFIWYRIYNELADNFIFFIDKVNYNILKRGKKSDILMQIAEFKGVEQEELNGKIYLNIDYNNFEQIFEFLFKDFKFRYFDNVENINYLKNDSSKLKKIEMKKKYCLNGNDFFIVGKEETSKQIELEIEGEIERNNFFDYIEKSKYFYPFYALFVIRHYEAGDARDRLRKCFEKYKWCEDKLKEEIAKIMLRPKGFENLTFKEKIGIISINFNMQVKKAELASTPLAQETLKDNGENAKYYYYIMINIVLGGYYASGDSYISTRKITKLSDEYYKKEIELVSRFNSSSKTILIVQDTLKNGSYAGTKLIFDIAKNIKKYHSDYRVIIYCEDNFFGLQEENLMVFDVNNRNIDTSKNYEKEHKNYLGNIEVEVIYSDINKLKKERVKDVIELAKSISPEIVLSTTIFSNTINLLQELFPTVYLSLGGTNTYNKFDLYLFPHLNEIVKAPGFKEYNPKTMVPFDYGGNFNKAEIIEKREKLSAIEEDFLIITVGVRLHVELEQHFVDMMIEFLQNNGNIKWLLVGTMNIPSIDEKYKDLLEKRIIKIKYIGNLGEVYRACDLYVNPHRLGGGFSMAEAIVNDLCVLTTTGSPAGALHCGKENGVKDWKEYREELEKLYKDSEYRNKKLKKEQEVQENLSYKNVIPKLMDYIKMAKELYFERKGKQI